MRNLTLLLGLAIGLAIGTYPATAAPVPLTVRVGEGYYPQADTTAPYTYVSPPCAISAAGPRPSGMAALLAAETHNCVSSFTVEGDDEAGHYLTCIDDRCEALGFYWAIYQNGKLTCVGLDDIRLEPKDELAFSYEPYPTALDLATC